MIFRSASEQGIFPFELVEYGRSVEGVSLRYLPSSAKTQLLIFAAIHGEEAETTFLLSRALRKLEKAPRHVACILSANPDGMLRGTRGNAHDVDLNRNFPTSNWKSEKTRSRLLLDAPRVTELSTGSFAGSEPETVALIRLIQKLDVQKVVSLHSPFGLVDADTHSDLACSMETVFEMPWQSGVGYPTPGSFGTYAAENGIDCVTVELPREAPELLVSRYAESFANFIANL